MAFQFARSAIQKLGRKSWVRSRPTICIWDIENNQVPSSLCEKLTGMVNRIRKNLQRAGFGSKVPMRAIGHHPHLKKEVISSFKEQRLYVKNVPEKMADNNIVALVQEWVRKHPNGGNIILFTGDQKLAQDCRGGPLFDLYVSARVKNLKKKFIDAVKPQGFWRWPDLLYPNAKMVDPQVIREEIYKLWRNKKNKNT